MKTLYLLDGSAFLYRSYFALPPLSTSKGFPTGAIFGFMRALFSIIKTEKPIYFCVAFDLPAPTKRDAIYADYKAKRPPMPDPLKLQIPVIKELIDLMGLQRYEVEGYEADDIIATLSWSALDKGFRVKVYSPDKDVMQLIGEKLIVINPISGEVFDRKKVVEKFGVPPEKLRDFLALVGDKVDNIEGIRGVGPKTAVKLLQQFGSVENILKNWDDFCVSFPEAKRESLELALSLLELHRIEGLEFDEDRLRVKNPDTKTLKEKFEELQMKSLLRELENLSKSTAQKSLF